MLILTIFAEWKILFTFALLLLKLFLMFAFDEHWLLNNINIILWKLRFILHANILYLIYVLTKHNYHLPFKLKNKFLFLLSSKRNENKLRNELKFQEVIKRKADTILVVKIKQKIPLMETRRF